MASRVPLINHQLSGPHCLAEQRGQLRKLRAPRATIDGKPRGYPGRIYIHDGFVSIYVTFSKSIQLVYIYNHPKIGGRSFGATIYMCLRSNISDESSSLCPVMCIFSIHLDFHGHSWTQSHNVTYGCNVVQRFHISSTNPSWPGNFSSSKLVAAAELVPAKRQMQWKIMETQGE